MTNPKQTLQDSSLVMAVGPRPVTTRNTLKMVAATTALVIAGLSGQVMAGQAKPASASTNQAQAAAPVTQALRGTVVSVNPYVAQAAPDTKQEAPKPEEGQKKKRLGTIAGAVIGGVLGQRQGGAIGAATGALSGASLGNGLSSLRDRLMHRRSSNDQDAQAVNAQQNVIVVAVQTGKTKHNVEIVQSAAIQLEKGDPVFLMPSPDGAMVALPETPQAAPTPEAPKRGIFQIGR